MVARVNLRFLFPLHLSSQTRRHRHHHRHRHRQQDYTRIAHCCYISECTLLFHIFSFYILLTFASMVLTVIINVCPPM